MRKFGFAAISLFAGLLLLVVALALLTAWHGVGRLAGLGQFHAIAVIVAAVLLVYVYGMAIHRIALRLMPVRAGHIAPGSADEFAYQVYILFYLMLFDGLTHSRLLPVPLMRLVYRVLGARMGSNSYSAGLILDPIFVTIGANSIIGDAALLVPHVIEGGKLGHFPIVIGDNVTIGAHAIILPGVVIGDDVIIAAHSMVAKGARIRSGELWAGVPARRLR
jgi:hypothetical protein